MFTMIKKFASVVQKTFVYFEFSSYVHDVYNDGGEMESLVEARLDLRLLESTTRFDDYTETGEYNDLLVVMISLVMLQSCF